MLNRFKELWSNRRYRALLILGIYFIFFIFVFLVFSSFNKQKVSVPLTGIDLFKTKTSYTYTISDDNLQFTINNNKIIYEKRIYDLNDIPEELNKYDISVFTPSLIYNFIKNGTLQSTNYVDKSDTYVIDAKTNIIEKDYGKFYIIVYKEETNITKVVIDLTYYNGYKYVIGV